VTCLETMISACNTNYMVDGEGLLIEEALSTEEALPEEEEVVEATEMDVEIAAVVEDDSWSKAILCNFYTRFYSLYYCTKSANRTMTILVMK